MNDDIKIYAIAILTVVALIICIVLLSNSKKSSIKKKIDESDEEILIHCILELRKRFNSNAKEIVVPFEMEIQPKNITFTIPQKGDKKKLLELSKMNVRQYKFDRLKQEDKLNPAQRNMRLMKDFQNLLQLPKTPIQIELFDNSNISGTSAVAACVVFKEMKPSKKDYRLYKLNDGADDLAEEISAGYLLNTTKISKYRIRLKQTSYDSDSFICVVEKPKSINDSNNVSKNYQYFLELIDEAKKELELIKENIISGRTIEENRLNYY